MSRRTLGIYIWLTAAYEIGILGWFQLREAGPPPVLLDPRGSLEWILASTVSRHYLILSILSAVWLGTAGLAVMSSRKMLWVYGVVESCLALPTVLLFGAVMFLGSGHIQFGVRDAMIAIAVIVFFSAVPVFFAFRLAVREGRSTAQA